MDRLCFFGVVSLPGWCSSAWHALLHLLSGKFYIDRWILCRIFRKRRWSTCTFTEPRQPLLLTHTTSLLPDPPQGVHEGNGPHYVLQNSSTYVVIKEQISTSCTTQISKSEREKDPCNEANLFPTNSKAGVLMGRY